jgi:PAS domain S-box-containing protein
MKRSRSIVWVAVIVSSVVLLLAGLVARRAVETLALTSEQVLQSKELELSLERALSTLRDAETGQRGFLLTGSEQYLGPYNEALLELDSRLSTVEARLKARDEPADTVSALREPVKLKLEELARTIALYRAGSTEQALAIVRTDEGKVYMDAIRSWIDARVLTEQRNVEALTVQEGKARTATIRSSIAVSALAIALMFALTYVVRRDSAKLRFSEERLATTLRSIGDAVIATDEQGLVTMINPVGEELTGWRFEQARGQPLDAVFHIVNEDTRATVESPVTKVLREGGIVGLANHTVLIHRTGGETAIEDSAAPITDRTGETTGVVLVFRDATSERAAQNALRLADRRKDEFLATLAHELRNPLAPIRQAAGLAAHPNATPEQIKWSHAVIERQTVHMARLLDDLLDVSRITRGHLEVRRARTSLKAVVEDAVETARPVIDARKHTLTVDLPATPIELDVDSLRIAQVLGNLFTNAAKYTAPGGIIRLAAERDGNSVLIRVIDNGIGLAPEDLPKIFEMFAQVKPTLDRKDSGLGIGLALSKALVQLHGGTLEGRSAGLGKGSEFSVRLPLAAGKADAGAPAVPAAAAQPSAVAAPTAAPAEARPVRKMRILLADDNRDACESLEILLGIEGHEVRVAYDGERALEEIESFRPDVALLDIGMPKINGYDVAAAVRNKPWGESVRLVAVTGWGQADDRARALAAGFDAHFVKPVDVAALQEFCNSLRAD